MKAKVIETGEIIEVKEWFGSSDGFYSTPDMNRFFQKSDLELLPDTEEVTIEGYVARDKGGGIYLHSDEPVRGVYEWYSVMCPPRQLPKESFPEVTWDSEPKRVKVTITPME